MNEFLANNWFSILTVIAVLGGTAVNYGMSKQRGIQTSDAVGEVKKALKDEVSNLEKYFKDEIEIVHNRTTANANAARIRLTAAFGYAVRHWSDRGDVE